MPLPNAIILVDLLYEKTTAHCTTLGRGIHGGIAGRSETFPWLAEYHSFLPHFTAFRLKPGAIQGKIAAAYPGIPWRGTPGKENWRSNQSLFMECPVI
ncbi:MAG: hypothetical protein OIF57_11470 [Marinobacterium sp.]|nr:hypothetical protein [Marinobacterium sp.]